MHSFSEGFKLFPVRPHDAFFLSGSETLPSRDNLTERSFSQGFKLFRIRHHDAVFLPGSETVPSTTSRSILFLREFVLRKAFKQLDKDGSGTLSRAEIEEASKKEAGLDIAAEKISDLLAALEKDKK